MTGAVCGNCGTDNPAGFKFCGQCGAALAAGCPACGFANPEGFRFCGQCGASLGGELTAPPPAAATPAPTQDERKLATVLFADVVGFTTLAENSDPETVARIVDAAFRRMGEVVANHGGTVDKYMGDCLMAVFGVPQAHDDDAERAIAAGLALRELGGDLAFSIGINTGEVMVASVGRDQDATVMGDTVNVAARLEKAAGPGEVLVGPLTAQLADSRVTLLEREPLLLKGKRERVAVFEAVAVRGRDDVLAAHDAPQLVGRDDELAFLHSLWRRVRRDGQVGVVMVTGEAGVGKTRLVDELIDEISGDALVARASYPAYGGFGGPRVAADIIRELGRSRDPDVDARVQAFGGDIDPTLRSLDHSAMQAEQAWAFRKLLLEKAEDQPLVIVIDDIHRSGDQTLEVLQKLATRVVEVPLLLVLAGRPEPGDWLSSFPSATTVRLSPLGTNDARALADALVPDLPLGAEAAASLVERSGGNPLYLRELVNVVRAQGGLVAKEGEHDLAGGVALPPSLRAVLAARLDALPVDDKAALQHVAVLGDAAREDHVHALGLENAGAALTSLVRAGLLRFTGDGRFDIIDPLLREVAYETLPRLARGTRHRQAAHVADNAVEAARHLDRATD
jgi:class 3 adenylate cyclase